MFETKNIVLILVILLLILLAYKMSNKSENLISQLGSKYSNFLQDFIKNQTDNSGNFMITDLSKNTIMKFKIMNDVILLNNINLLNDNNEGTLINDNDNNMILIGKIKIADESYSFIYSINDITITVDNSGNPSLNLVAVTPAINYINPNQIQFNDGILTIIIDNSGNSVNFPSNLTDKNQGSKLIGYTDNGKYGFGIKLQDGTKKMIASQSDISSKLQTYYPYHNDLIKTTIFTSLVNNLQEYLKNYKK